MGGLSTLAVKLAQMGKRLLALLHLRDGGDDLRKAKRSARSHQRLARRHGAADKIEIPTGDAFANYRGELRKLRGNGWV